MTDKISPNLFEHIEEAPIRPKKRMMSLQSQFTDMRMLILDKGSCLVSRYKMALLKNKPYGIRGDIIFKLSGEKIHYFATSKGVRMIGVDFEGKVLFDFSKDLSMQEIGCSLVKVVKEPLAQEKGMLDLLHGKIEKEGGYYGMRMGIDLSKKKGVGTIFKKVKGSSMKPFELIDTLKPTSTGRTGAGLTEATWKQMREGGIFQGKMTQFFREMSDYHTNLKMGNIPIYDEPMVYPPNMGFPSIFIEHRPTWRMIKTPEFKGGSMFSLASNMKLGSKLKPEFKFEFKPNFITSQLSSTSMAQMQRSGQIQSQEQSQRQIQKQRQQQRQEQSQMQEQALAFDMGFKQKLTEKQKTPERTRIRIPFPSSGSSKTRTQTKKGYGKPLLSGEEGYELFVKKRGKFKGMGLFTKEKALDIGAYETRESASAQFKLVPTDIKVRDMKGTGYFQAHRGVFREYRIEKGRRIETPLTFIQKRGERISTRGEKREITYKGKRWL
jgi:hypothetical protein